MQSTSDLYKQILSNTSHRFEVSVTIGGQGVLIDEAKDWIDFGQLVLSGSIIDEHTAIIVDSGEENNGIRENALISVRTSNQLFSENTPSIGNAVAGQIELKILDFGFNVPRMAEIRPYIRATDGENTSEWVPMGVYYTDTRTITKNADGLDIWTLNGFDAMLKAEQAYPEDGETKASAVVRKIAALIGLKNTDICAHVWEIITTADDVKIQCSGEWTCREHLQYIAALYGGNWTITHEGKLNLIQLSDVPYETSLLTDEVGFTINFGAAEYNDTGNAERVLV